MDLSSPNNRVHRIFFLGSAVFIGIAACATLGYAAWQGYIPLPFLQRNPTTQDVLTAVQGIRSGTMSSTFELAVEPKDANVPFTDITSLVPASLETNEDMNFTTPFSGFDTNAYESGNIKLQANSAFLLGDTLSEETEFSATFSAQDMQERVSGELQIATKTIDGEMYINPKKVSISPYNSLLDQAEPFLNTWVRLGEENRSVFLHFNEDVQEDEALEEPADVRKEFLTLIEHATRDGALIFSTPSRVKDYEVPAWKTVGVIDGEKLRATMLRMGKERAVLFPEETHFALFSDEFLELTEKEESLAFYKTIFQNTSLTLIIDKTGLPLRTTLLTRIAPKGESATEPKQVRITADIQLDNVNSPLTIQPPAGALSFSEASWKAFGIDPIVMRKSAQEDTVIALREALEIYAYTHQYTYPATLNELVGIADENQKVVRIPSDLFTGKPYVYARAPENTEGTYTLQFVMPETPADSQYDFSIYPTVTGINTASYLFFSEEGAKITDEDGDGLSAYEEQGIYGTNDYYSDTDLDGLTDKEEVGAGSSPINP